MSGVQSEAELAEGVRAWLAGFRADAPVVVVPVFNAYDDAADCIASLLDHTDAGTPILVIDDASSDERIAGELGPLLARQGHYFVRKRANTGFVGSANCAFSWCAPRDVVLVNSDLVLPRGWLERLAAAARSSSTVATATPLTNNGSIVSVPYRNRPQPDLPPGLTLDEADARVRAASFRLRPFLPVAIGHCVYFRRTALDAVGHFDETFAPGYGEEVDFSLRAGAVGFSHVLADDLFVYHKGSRSFGATDGAARSALQAGHEQIINARYPWYRQVVLNAETDERSDLALALERAGAALQGYSIAVDGTLLGGPVTGTQVVTLELIRGLVSAAQRFARVSVIIRDGVAVKHLHGIDRLADRVVYVSELLDAKSPQFDLVHCPFQLWSADQWRLLRRISRRLVVSQLDCISYSTPACQPSVEDWHQYRRLTRSAFASADGIVFLTESAQAEARQHGLIAPPERACVTYVGVDHRHDEARPAAPAGAEAFAGQPFILVLGTNFRHKNRVHAIRLLDALSRQYGWSGNLVLAGPRVAYGGSEAEEALEMQRHPELAARIHFLGAVSGGEKAWLLANTALLLYPSIREGFGMVPFEAAAAGTPAITTRLASLPEVLGEEVAYLDTLDPCAGAAVAWSLLNDPAAAGRQVAAIQARAALFRWDEVAARTWRFYSQVLTMPPRQAPELAPEADGAAANGSGAIIAEPTAGNWPERVRRALRIWRKHGWGALAQETRQYLNWLTQPEQWR